MSPIYHQVFFNAKQDRAGVVFLHAFPLDSRMWEPQMSELRGREIPFLAPDYPGFGKSSAWKKKPAMADFSGLVYASIKRLGFDKVVVVGLSMGGYVALSLYASHPEIFCGLVLANTRAEADSEEARQRRFELIEAIKKNNSLDGVIQFHLQKFYSPRTRQKNRTLLQRTEEIMRDTPPSGIIAALNAMAGRPDSTALPEKIPFSVLVIASEEDELIPVEASRAMAEKLQKGRLALIGHAAHLSNMENPAAFNEELLTYLDTIPGINR